MKVLLAPDKFKGSLTAAEVAAHLAEGLAGRGVIVDQLPLADGGDGSVAAAVAAGFTAVPVTVAAATGRLHTAQIAVNRRSRPITAVVEVAGTCGLHTLPDGRLAPLTAASTGVGQAVRCAVEQGAQRVVLALGGSASTDGGAGMLAALGAVFRDTSGHVVQVAGGTLSRIASVDLTGLLDLGAVELVIASDVANPLLGPDGAAAVYGPQKGADAADVITLENGLQHLLTQLTAAFPAAPQLAAHPGYLFHHRLGMEVGRALDGWQRGVAATPVFAPATPIGPPGLQAGPLSMKSQDFPLMMGSWEQQPQGSYLPEE